MTMNAGRPEMRIGVDLGGTKTEIVAIDRAGAERERRRVATPAHAYDAVIECIAGLVRDVEQQLGARGSVGVGTPGALSPATGALRNSNTACLNGKAIDRDLGRALGREIRIANDANCFALSEAVDGAGRGASVVFGVILGTGVGGGVVVGGRVLQGRNAIAGEWGHNPLPSPGADELPGPPCYCGKRGCVETFLSGPGLARDFERANGERVTGAEVADRAQNRDPAAMQSLDRYLDRLARSLAVVINVIDPDVVVLGGGVSRIARLYDELPQRVSAYAFSDRLDTRIAAAVHGDSSGVRGAAWLWSDQP
jgi:fructokinase